MTPVDIQQRADVVSSLTATDILQTGERLTRLEVIPLTQILSENALIDESHADDLAKSMRSDLKQISPITVRARFGDEGQVLYDVVDGFHRVAGMRLNEVETINASVVYNISDSELYDLRILAASSVKSVQFARVATWMKQSFSTTPWAEKGMNVTHAFGVAVNDTQRVQRVKLSPEEIEGVKEWVKESSKRWMRPVSSTYENLRLVDDADPNLVRQVRYIGGGKDRTAVVTPARLRAVVNAFPGEENHPIQRAVMRIVLEHRLYAPEAAELTRQAQEIVKAGMDEESAYLALNAKLRFNEFAIVFKPEKPAQAKGKKKTTGIPAEAESIIGSLRDTNKSLSTSLRALQDTVLPQLRGDIERLRQENASLRAGGRQTIEEASASQTRIRELEQQVAAFERTHTGLASQNLELKTQNKNLRNAIDQLRADMRKKQVPDSTGELFESEPWYRTDPRVSQWEREALDAMLREDVDLNEFARKHGKTLNDIVWDTRAVLNLRATGSRSMHVQKNNGGAEDNKTMVVKNDGDGVEEPQPMGTSNTIYQATSSRKIAQQQAGTPALRNNGQSTHKTGEAQTDVTREFSPEAVAIATSFLEAHNDLIKSMGFELFDQSIAESIYDAVVLNSRRTNDTPTEIKRIFALGALQKVLSLPDDKLQEFIAAQSENYQYMLRYVLQLRAKGAFGQLLQVAVDEKNQYYNTHRGNIGPKMTTSST